MLIAMLSDFGYEDCYVGVMKSVIYDIFPEARIVDLCHEVPPQDVATGAWLLAEAVNFLPTGSVVVAVVDPGVGTARRPIAVRTDRLTFIGPDNGIFGVVLRNHPADAAVELREPEFHLHGVSKTFHGRDIFAPTAAWLASGVELRDLGPAIDVAGLEALDVSEPEFSTAKITANVIHVDRFGNLVTDLDREGYEAWAWDKPALVQVPGQEPVAIEQTFADVDEGEVVAYFGSFGMLELAVRCGNASEVLGIARHGVIELVRE